MFPLGHAVIQFIIVGFFFVYIYSINPTNSLRNLWSKNNHKTISVDRLTLISAIKYTTDNPVIAIHSTVSEVLGQNEQDICMYTSYACSNVSNVIASPLQTQKGIVCLVGATAN